MRAAVPTTELRDALGSVEGVDIVVWDGVAEPPSGIGFLVPDYRSRLSRRSGQLSRLFEP